ncbi:MAG: T9SS type A sorting domain-containing protein [Bacteroidales bacterium]|nr:T9SS type A sorting domain-containing protein [Bacteroidales bacterium]
MTKTRLFFHLPVVFLFFFILRVSAQETTILHPTEVKFQDAYTTTIPLRDMEFIPSKGKSNFKNGIVPNGGLPEHLKTLLQNKVYTEDPVIQKAYNLEPSVPEALVQNFEGISNTYNVAPPDTHGDVGLNHYIQMVNNGFQIFDKSGNAITSATSLSTLWNNLPGPWNGTNDGDPVVLYDETENRWIMTQFSLPNYPYATFYELIAVSATSDPLGSWHLYAFSFSDMPDYPKFGVWPDGLYMSINRFASGTGNYAGTGAVAFEKLQMLQGMPAQMIYFTFGPTTDPWSFLPSDLDGPAPAISLPNYFTYVDYWSGTDRLRMYQFSANWITPASSTFSGPTNINVASINNSFSTDIVQPGTSQTLDPLEDRLMYRLQFRDFGTYKVMLTNHTVNVGSNRAGIRWYELRNYGGGWTLFQQGTYAPSDSHSRWLASIAMNRNGDIALGYSVSSSSLSPSIRYTGRLSGDTPGSMGQPETTIVTGSGNQTGTYRWGDYSMMSVDPEDDYTFWYTQEYVNPGGSYAWKTRIASLQFGTAPVADVWTGTGSTIWLDPNNWSDGSVPYRSDDVIINSSPTPSNWPVVIGDLITGLTVNNLTVNGNAMLTVTGDVEVSEGTALNSTGASNIYVGGDWTVDGQFSPGTGTVVMNGNSAGMISSAPLTAWERATLYQATSYSNSNYFDIVTNSNDITIDAFDLNCYTTGSVNIEIWYRTDTYVGHTSSSTGWIKLGSTKVVTGSGGNAATHVIPDVPLTILAGSTYGIFISAYTTGGLILFTTGSNSFFDPNITINCGVASTGNQPGTGTIFSNYSWNGTLYYTTGANVSLSFYNLQIDKTDAEVITDCDVAVSNDLTVNSHSFLTNGTGKTLNIGNDLTLSTSSGRTGSFIDNGTLSVSGTTTVENNYIDNRWHFISSPVASEVSALFTGIYLKYWKESTYSWEYIIALDSLMRVGTGYEMWSTLGNPTIGYSLGGLNTGAVTPALYATDPGADGLGATEGWNMVGNPFASAIDLGAPGNVLPGYTWTNLDYTVYTWNGVGYATYNPVTGIANNGSRYVPAMQGFFVKANALNPVLQFPVSARTHSTLGNYKNKSDIPSIKLNAHINNFNDGFIFGQIENALPGYDGQFDAYQLDGIEEAPQIFQLTEDEKLSINLISQITSETQIELGYKAGTAGIHALSLSEVQGLDDIAYIILEDLVTGTASNLLENNTYQFSASPGDIEHRFNLYFDEITTSIDVADDLVYSVYAGSQQIHIEFNKPVSGVVSVYNMLGQPVTDRQMENQQKLTIIHNLPAGVYILKGLFGDKQLEKKLIIK